MELTSLQVCMDSPDHWLQGTINQEETGMDSSTSPISGDILTCSRPMIERRLRPPHDQALKCPRCDSNHTKFCYYNNYSLSQPRYFCKTCRRYWTKGGTLRNVPVGGGCKKNKKVSSSSSSSSKKSLNNNDQFLNINKNLNLGGSTSSSTSNYNQGSDNHHLQLSSFPHEVQFSHIANLLGNHFGGFGINHNFMDTKFNTIPILENPTQIDFMDNALVGGSREIGMISDMTNTNSNLMEVVVPNNFHNFCTTTQPFGMSNDGNHGGLGLIMDNINCQRLMLPYDHHQYSSSHDQDHQSGALDVKPNAKLLSMEWHDQGCSNDGGKEPYGYFNGVGSWPGLMNGYGSSTTSHLV